MHLILIGVDLLVMVNLVSVLWGALYLYMVYWAYMVMYRAILALYIILLGWSTVTAILGAIGSNNFLVSVLEAGLYGLVTYAIFLKIYAYHKGLQRPAGQAPDRDIEKNPPSLADLKAEGKNVLGEATNEANKKLVNEGINAATGKVSNAMENIGEKVNNSVTPMK